MKKTIRYSKTPRDIKTAIDNSLVIEDFLASPDKLVSKERTIKITLAITQDSFSFFRSAAQRNHVSYQKMIRALLDQYSKKHRKLA